MHRLRICDVAGVCLVVLGGGWHVWMKVWGDGRMGGLV
jgi:hypothetical protein